MASFHIRQLVKMKLTGIFRILCCRIVPKLCKLVQEFLINWHLNAVASLDIASEKNELLNLSLGGITYFISLFSID